MHGHCDHQHQHYSRRDFLTRTSLGLGGLALSSLMGSNKLLAGPVMNNGGMLGRTHFPAKAKRIIYLFQSGAPSQLDLFDYKPLLNQRNGKNCRKAFDKARD